MKTLILIFTLIVINLQSMNANPIILFYFSELIVDSSGWKIELHLSGPVGPQPLDGWYFTTLSDTAYLKNGIVLDTNYLIITQESLATPLFVNRNGDHLSFCGPYGVADRMIFGEISNTLISAPRSGQSICFREYRDEFQRYFYYLDNTSTLGCPNDSANARGTIRGTVTDLSGNPLSGVKIIYDYANWMGYQMDIYVLTDSAGKFTLDDYARLEHLKIEKDGYEIKTLTVQIWPESDTSISNIELIVGICEEHFFSLPSYELEQVYPSPFNQITAIKYKLPAASRVMLKIYNILGQEVKILVDEIEDAGYKSIEWNASNIASSVYLYHFEATSVSDPRKTFTQVKKMVLVR